jgi:methylated-DNA-protein-cysteine methyltransferase-like protein
MAINEFDDAPRRSFNDLVHALVRLVPEGRVVTYGAIARALGAPRKAREVGWAMASCPADVPAHRVLNRLGCISGGATTCGSARWVRLEAEGVRLDAAGCCNLTRCEWDPTGPARLLVTDL